jgi:uncharacterized protein (TIGR03435 family)
MIVDIERQEARARELAAPAGAPRRSSEWSDAAAWAYGLIAFACIVRFATGVWLARRLTSAARRVECGAWESDRIAVPVTVGCWRPRVLLPATWREWPREKLDAVLTHEGAHARRRDGLVAAMAAVNRCVFWFHPLAWMLERRLALLAELACDEYSVAALRDRDRYARLLVDMAGLVDLSQGRLRGHALTMAAASHIRQRVEALLRPGRSFSPGLSRTGRTVLAACAIPLVFATGAVEIEQQTAQTPAGAVAVPKFDVASVKPCDSQDTGGKSTRGGRGGGGRGIRTTPGRLHVGCMTVREMLLDSYVRFQDDAPVNTFPGDEGAVRGGPGWVSSDRYTIEAESDDPRVQGPTEGRGLPAMRLMTGPMLRALLADRFRLKVRREEEEIPLYALTVAKGGFKLKPMEEGTCRVPDPTRGMTVAEANDPTQKPMCGTHIASHGPNWTVDANGATMKQSASWLGGAILDRPVVDKTGLAGLYSYRLEFARDESAPGKIPAFIGPKADPDIPAGPSLYAELEKKMGLKLVADKGPRGYVVIESIERPIEN